MDSRAQILAAGIVALVAALVVPLVARWERRRDPAAAADLLRLRAPAFLIAAVLVLFVTGRVEKIAWLRATGRAGLILGAVWAVSRVLWIAQQAAFRRLHIDVADNRRARGRRTQIDLLRRAAVVVTVIIGMVVLLLTVSVFRSFGPRIVAYTGVVAAVLGIALRSPLDNLAAGVTIALTEPFRIDDVVVVEGEWGRIEQIGLVNVIVRVWDDRRLVIPTARLVQEPFENWTHRTAEITGSVTAWVGYDTDIDDLRSTVGCWLRDMPRWDGRAGEVQVVGLDQHAVQVRVLVTARNAPAAWDLRCEVREKLLSYLRAEPGRLPTLRTHVEANGRARA